MFKTMNSSYLREIPLRILNRKIGDEHVTLLQACYDNPIFNEEDGKGIPHQNGAQKPGKPAECNGVEVCNSLDGRHLGIGGHMASDYMHSLPPTSSSQRASSNDINFRGHRKRKWRCILISAGLFVALVLGIALLIYFLEEDQSSDDANPSVISLAKIEVNLTLKSGPFSVFQPDYRIPDSDASRLLRRAFVYKISDIFSSPDISSIYQTTNIVKVRNVNGSVALNFIIRPPPRVTYPANSESRISDALLQGLDNSLFIVDANSISVKIYAVPAPPSTPRPGKTGECFPITFSKCINMTSYSTWTPPNIFGHRSDQEVAAYLSKYISFLDSRYSSQFYCSAFYPGCPSDGGKHIYPCRQYCRDVKASYKKEYEQHNMTFTVPCESLADSEDPDVCVQSPYKIGQCVPVTHKECTELGFNHTSFPNALGSISIDADANTFVYLISKVYPATHCFKNSVYFSCAVVTPPCTGMDYPKHYIPPCRSLCQNFKDGCEIFINLFNVLWPENLNCSSLPDSPDPTVCTGYHEARERDHKVCYKDDIKCMDDSKTCIHKKWMCDGIQDCPSNWDEKHCAMCEPGKERCSSSSAFCIDKNQVCDGIADCYGESDEIYCVRLDPDSEDDVLQVKNPISSRWDEVCKDGWTQDFSDMTCKQLGYSKAMATYYTPQNQSSFPSMITTMKNGSDPNRLQSYLNKGEKLCPSRYVVKLLCWNAVSKCGVRPAHVPAAIRVMGGQEVLPGTWPWMVSLHGGTEEKFFCGGTIIRDDWVLTAGHCMGGAQRETSYWTIKTGNTRREVFSEHRQVRKPKQLFAHQEFLFPTVENDIALIHLDKPFKMNDYVRAICLPERSTDPGTRCMVTGWGKNEAEAPNYQRTIHQVGVDVTTWNHCYHALLNSETPSPYALVKSMFCAGGATGHDGCQGDSGGPLVCKKENTTDEWYQAGIVSWGIACGLANVPGVYTDLTFYKDWIHDTIANNSNTVGVK